MGFIKVHIKVQFSTIKNNFISTQNVSFLSKLHTKSKNQNLNNILLLKEKIRGDFV